MSSYIHYIIEALEDLKLSKTNVQIDAEKSMDYITGSSMRGAYIYKYIKEYKVTDINIGEHKDKLLKGGIKFLNAYPMYEEERAIPFPKCYFAPKQDIRRYLSGKADSLRIRTGIDKELNSGLERVRVPEFAVFQEDNFININVNKIANLHINKEEEKNRLFRYEAIERGQKFKGLIKIEKKEYEKEVFDLLSDSIIYIGGSKGSGYGKCKITLMEGIDNNPEFEQFRYSYEFNNEMYLIALSDIIYRSSLGQYKTYVEPEVIKKALDINEVKQRGSCIETKRITSFNNKWNCNTPQIVGIKAGSVFKYKFEGQINEDLLKAFMDRGIGERKNEGFGRFAIINSLWDSSLYRKTSEYRDRDNIFELMEKLIPEDKEQVEKILNNIYEQRVDSDINKEVLRMYKDIDNGEKLNRSQWGTYLAMFKSLYFEEPDNGIKKYQDYMKHINGKISSSLKQINRVKFNKKPITEYLEAFIRESNSTDIFYQKNKAKRIEIGNIKSGISSDFAYKKNIKKLIELCRYHLRKESDKQ